MHGFNGRAYIVTGGSDGIGLAAVRLLVERDARVMIADVDVERGEAAVASIGSAARFIRTDISSEEDVKAMVAATVAAFGQLDGALNNAGTSTSIKKLHEIDLAVWQRLHAVNLTGTFLCMKYEIAQMLTSGGGAIVNTASIAGLVGVKQTGEQTAAKHGVAGLTKVAALDYGLDNIRVNAIAPGSTLTKTYAGSLEKQAKQGLPHIEAGIPMGRAAQPSELAEAAVWLLSDASSFVTGVILPVDGGYTAL
jgi:2,5-dichloro-2,5-cyclohexadiene-1,4-diol dehydrogenase 1